MKLTQTHIDFIKAKMVHEFTEGQSSDSYWFEVDQITFIWAQSEEMFYALKSNKTWDYYRPSDVDEFVDSLSQQQLIEWMIDDFGCDAEDLVEYIEDELDLEAE